MLSGHHANDRMVMCPHHCRILQTFEKFIPWIALILLGYISGSMLINGIRGTDEDDEIPGVGPKALFIRALQPPLTPCP